MDIVGLFSLLKEVRRAAEELRRLSAEIAYAGRRPYPQASWQVMSSLEQEHLLPPLESLRANAERLLQGLEELGRALPSYDHSQGQTESIFREIRGFIHLCTALRERIEPPLPEAPLDAPYGAGAPKVPPPATSAMMVAEAAQRLADEVTSWLLWKVNVRTPEVPDP